jgi:integrase
MATVEKRRESPKLARVKGHPGIYRRGGRYVVVFRDPSGRQRKRSCRTLAEARTVKSTLTADVARGEFRALSRVTFAEYAPEWLTGYRGRTRRGFGDSTRDDYRAALEREAIPFFGRLRLAEVEPRDAKRFVTYLESPQPLRLDSPRAVGLGAGSVRKIVAPVRALFATAVEEGLIRSNPFAGLRIASATTETIDDTEAVKALAPEQLRDLLDVLAGDELEKRWGEWRLFFEFLALTGLRIGEAIELRWGDVDLGGRSIQVRRQFSRGRVGKPKSRKARRVRLSPALARGMWRLQATSRAGDDELVFTAERGGRIVPTNLMRRVLKPAAVNAGLGSYVGKPARAESWVGFHTFRHTNATMLFRAGWNAKQVQLALGHADPGFTLRTYVHLLDEDVPETGFLDDVLADRGGNTRATRPPENTRDAEEVKEQKTRMVPEDSRVPEVVAAFS